MKFSTNALVLALATSVAASTNGGLPANHPPVRGMHPTLARFSSQLRCPYANEWLTKGAHKAAIDLGLTTKVTENPEGAQRRRHLQASGATAMGSCSFTNQWTGPSCMEFRGDAWTQASMEERCALEQDSSLSTDGCPQPDELAGWCITEPKEGSIEASSMMISGMADCDGNKMACETFVGGAFAAASGCGGGVAAPEMDYSNMGPPADGESKCIIAPGAIGAAHQSGFSDGYSNACPGTPAEGSPYMWPLAWSADVDTQNLAFGYDEVVHHSRGRTFYRLDKNWKRSDLTLAKGVRRGVGQGPCENIDAEQSEEGVVACITDMDMQAGDPMETMIHRGSKMYFITWKNSTDVQVGATDPSLIAECNYLDLMVIGNIRPDWFLDDRGDDTDVQYLGDQHIYYASSVPRLAKQWRKKDFASQYFTMSVSGNPPTKNSTDQIRWPLVLNIPGEGFGDDMLQVYANHTLLSDEDDDIFDLVQNLEASGGSCPLLSGGFGADGESEATFGPPTLEVHVPSNLEVDENSWFTNVYTFSPVWQPPMKVESSGGASAGTMAVTDAGRVKVESCYDASSKSVKLAFEFQDIEAIPTESGLQLPWMSIGYRPDAVCSMTPVDGSDTELIMISQSEGETFPQAYKGSMGPNTKRFDPNALGSIYESLQPLEASVGYSGVSLTAPMLGAANGSMISRSTTNEGSVVLTVSQAFDEKPETMHLMYAIGMSATLGIHTARSCFEIVEFPTCSMNAADDNADLSFSVAESILSGSTESSTSSMESSSSASTWFSATFGALVLALVGALFV